MSIVRSTNKLNTDLEVAETKLVTIESGATADQTKADIDALGIDADTVNSLTVQTAVPAGAVFTDTNTWRPVQNVLTSTSTTESLSAAQGKALSETVSALTHVDVGAAPAQSSVVYTGSTETSVANAWGPGLYAVRVVDEFITIYVSDETTPATYSGATGRFRDGAPDHAYAVWYSHSVSTFFGIETYIDATSETPKVIAEIHKLI